MCECGTHKYFTAEVLRGFHSSIEAPIVLAVHLLQNKRVIFFTLYWWGTMSQDTEDLNSKDKTVACIFYGLRYSSKYSTALPLDRGWGACRDGTDTGVTSLSQDPQILQCECRGAKSRTWNLFPEMLSSPEESGRKLRVWDNLEHLPLHWKGMGGSLRPASVSHVTCTLLPSFL